MAQLMMIFSIATNGFGLLNIKRIEKNRKKNAAESSCDPDLISHTNQVKA